MFRDGDILELSGGFEVQVRVEQEVNVTRLTLFRGASTERVAFTDLHHPVGRSWGQWEDAHIGSNMVGNVSSCTSSELEAQGEFLQVVAMWLERADAQATDRKARWVEQQERERLEAEREREADAERRRLELGRKAVLNAQREELALHELLGEVVRVREHHKKISRLATVVGHEVATSEGLKYVPKLKYHSDRDYQCSTRLRDIRMLKVKEGKGYRVVWDDGDEDLHPIDRKAEY